MATAIEKLQARMTKMSDVTQDFRGIIYGESGVGKTVLAMKIAKAITPEGQGIIFADARQGWSALLNHPDLMTQQVMRFPVETADDLTALGAALLSKEGMFAYVGCVVVDESSVIASDNLTDNIRQRLGVPADQVVRAVPEWPDYNANQVEMSSAIGALEAVDGVHVIQVAHIRYDKDNRGVERMGPDFTPGLSKKLRRDVHLVAKLDARLDRNSDDDSPEYLRELQVQPSALVVAKTRIGGLPVKVHPDTLVSEIAMWLGSGELAPENVDLAEDETPTDGLPVVGNPNGDDSIAATE